MSIKVILKKHTKLLTSLLPITPTMRAGILSVMVTALNLPAIQQLLEKHVWKGWTDGTTSCEI